MWCAAAWVASAQEIIDAVITAENNKAGLTIVGKLVDMPSRVRLFQGIRKSKPHAAPGPDLIGPGIYRHQKAIAWSVEQQFALATKQALTLRAPLQSRGGALFALWKKSSLLAECMSHRAILCANTDGKNIAKMERAQVLDTIEEELSSDFLLQCGGMRGRGTDIANVLVRAVFATQACRETSGAGVYVDVVSAFCFYYP